MPRRTSTISVTFMALTADGKRIVLAREQAGGHFLAYYDGTRVEIKKTDAESPTCVDGVLYNPWVTDWFYQFTLLSPVGELVCDFRFTTQRINGRVPGNSWDGYSANRDFVFEFSESTVVVTPRTIWQHNPRD